MTLSNREITLIIVLLFLLSGSGYLTFYFIPKTAQIATLRSEVEQKNTEVNDAASLAVQYGALMARKYKMLETWDKIIEPIPELFDDADILTRVQQTIGPYTNNISIRFTSSNDTLQKTQIHSVDIGFTATYNQLQSILTAFSEKSIANRILNLSCTLNKDYEETAPLLNINMQAEFQTLKDLSYE